MTLQATLPWAHHENAAIRRCARCGIEREAKKSTALCESCRYSLTADEAKAWSVAA